MNTSSISKQIPETVVAHLGARLHYGVAKVLDKQGILKKLFTDFYLDRHTTQYQLLNSLSNRIPFVLLKKVLQRTSSIDRRKVASFPLLGIRYWLEQTGKSGDTNTFLKYNRKFGSKVAESLPELSFNSVYGFTGSSVEIFLKARELHAKTFLEQMSAPVSTSQEIVEAEKEKWPGWQSHVRTLWNIDEWHSRELKEWDLADQIIVPSPYVEKQLTGYNINQTKISCIPYAVSLDQYPPKQRIFNGSRKLNTLYVGDLRLLKGIPYLLEAISKIGFDRIDLACVGKNHLDNSALLPYRDKARFTGVIPRREVLKWYEWADVLVMPSLCEGSSTVTYEAKVSGLPIIATFNSGAWLEDGVDGFLIPVRNSDGIIKALEKMLSKPTLVNQMSNAAIGKREKFGWEAYRQNLYDIIASGMVQK